MWRCPAEDHVSRSRRLEEARRCSRKTDLNFHIATPKLFSNDHYIPALQKVCDNYGAKIHLKSNLTVAVRPDREGGRVHGCAAPAQQTTVALRLHARDAADERARLHQAAHRSRTRRAGSTSIKGTLQHTRYPNVFALGDASNLPTSKTGAAVRKQAPTVAEEPAEAVLSGQLADEAQYDGYTSCPLVTGYGSLILAEFGYSGDRMETFPFDQRKERWSMYQLKRHLLPQLYWEGDAEGPSLSRSTACDEPDSTDRTRSFLVGGSAGRFRNLQPRDRLLRSDSFRTRPQ